LENQVILGDCLKEMKSFSYSSIDLLLTDPPYGINLQPQRTTGQFKNEKITNDDNLDDWIDPWCNEIHRVCKNACYIFCDYHVYDKFKTSLEKVGFTIKNCLIWDKMWFGMGNNWRPNHEFIILAIKTKFQTKSNNLENILRFRRLHFSKMTHVAEKPVPLLELIIKESSNEGDVVLDCFGGSGSTAEACINTNRKYIIIEKEPKYYEVIKKRTSTDRVELPT